MRFINNNWRASLCWSAFAFFLCGICLLSVVCQSKEKQISAVSQKCQELLDKGEIQNIGSCYIEAMKADSEHAAEISKAGETAIFAKRLDYKHDKDFEKSIICLEGMIALRPDSANVNFQLADSYYEFYLQDYKKTGRKDSDLLIRAKEFLKTGLEINPNDGRAYALNGEIFKETGSLESAVTNYKKAVEIQPGTGIFWLNLAYAQAELNQNGEAISSLKQALNINPNDTDALYFLAKQYERMGKLSDALESYEKLLKLEPSDEGIVQKVKEVKALIGSGNQNTLPKKKAKTNGN